MGCAPYLQIFKAGKLLFTTAAAIHVQQTEEELPFVYASDGTVCFDVDKVIQGDILIRCRHLTFKKQRVSMFRAAFHTGYVPPNVLRLTKSHLDGACTDKRFSDDFFLDLIFEKADTKAAAEHLSSDASDDDDNDASGTRPDVPFITADSNDSMLLGESRFWQVIAKRRQEQSGKSGQSACEETEGKTVGRRRDTQAPTASKGKETSGAKPDGRTIGAFSIGNDFDFLPPAAESQVEGAKDTLMEALDALDEDENLVEEITFATTGAEESEKPAFNKTLSAADDATEASELEKLSLASKTEGEDSNPDETFNMDALLASTGDDIAEMNLDDFDVDDDLDDLDDLEAMLNT